MLKLIDSIQENGQMVPVFVRPAKDGNGYEMIAGHRRKFAFQQLGMTEIQAIVRDLDDDQATILMVDSNVQRENILPTERGYAYKMRLEAMKHQGKRLLDDSTLDPMGPKYVKDHSYNSLAEQVGESQSQLKRYIRLTYLIEPIQRMVDGNHEYNMNMAFRPACEISFLKEDEQQLLYQTMLEMQATPSLQQAQQIKKRSQEGKLDESFIDGILASEKPNQKEKLSFKSDEIDYFFPKTYTPKQKKDVIIKLLSAWNKKREVER
jgi:ParB family chromosome partitioning protein